MKSMKIVHLLTLQEETAV